MDANLSVRTMGFVNILFYRDQSSLLRSGETLQTHQTEGNASWIPRPQWPIKPCITPFLCKRNGSSMWVSLHQRLMQLTPLPEEARGCLDWCAIKESHYTISVCLSYLADMMLVLGEQRRYCVWRSKQLYRDLDSRSVSCDGETKEKTEMLTRTLQLTRWFPPWCEALQSVSFGATLMQTALREHLAQTHTLKRQCFFKPLEIGGRFQPVYWPMEEYSVLQHFVSSWRWIDLFHRQWRNNTRALYMCGQTHDVGVSFLGDQRRVSFVKFATHLKYPTGDGVLRGLRFQFNRTSCCKEWTLLMFSLLYVWMWSPLHGMRLYYCKMFFHNLCPFHLV